MKIPLALLASLTSVLTGSILLSGVIPSLISGTEQHIHTNVVQAEAATLPFHVIDHFTEKRMAGDAQSSSSIQIDDEFVDPEQHCEFCTRVEYTPGAEGVAGFAYSSEDAIDFTGAKKIHFWVMGEDGGEKVKFKVAGKNRADDNTPRGSSLGIFKSERFAQTTEEVTLAGDWKKYEVDLEGTNLDDITHPFGLELAKGAGERTQVLYIKGVIIDDEDVDRQNALATTTEDNESGDQDMTVEITADEVEGDTTTSFRFRASVDGGERPYSYLWNFNDGSEEESNSRTIAHTFAEPGTYNVTLVVTDDNDLEAIGSIEIEIAEEPETEQNQTNDSTEEPQEDEEGSMRDGNATSADEEVSEANATATEDEAE